MYDGRVDDIVMALSIMNIEVSKWILIIGSSIDASIYRFSSEKGGKSNQLNSAKKNNIKKPCNNLQCSLSLKEVGSHFGLN
jgi:hypothetical protein